MTRSVFTHNMTQPSMVTSVSTGTRAGEGAEYASVSNATNSTFAKVQSTSAGSGKRHTEASGAQAWDATTYHGLLIILKDPNAPVAASCAAVEECLALNKDNLRGFFEQCFAPLMATVFGYDQTYPGRGGWVNRVAFEVQAGRAGRGGVAKSPGGTPPGSGQVAAGRHGVSSSSDVVALRRLFAPKGRLFMAMSIPWDGDGVAIENKNPLSDQYGQVERWEGGMDDVQWWMALILVLSALWILNKLFRG